MKQMLKATCRYCRRSWSPKEGVDASIAFCSRCAKDRQTEARKTFLAEGKADVAVGPYELRVAKKS